MSLKSKNKSIMGNKDIHTHKQQWHQRTMAQAATLRAIERHIINVSSTIFEIL